MPVMDDVTIQVDQTFKHFPARAGLSVTFLLGQRFSLLMHLQSINYNVMLSGFEEQND